MGGGIHGIARPDFFPIPIERHQLSTVVSPGLGFRVRSGAWHFPLAASGSLTRRVCARRACMRSSFTWPHVHSNGYPMTYTLRLCATTTLLAACANCLAANRIGNVPENKPDVPTPPGASFRRSVRGRAGWHSCQPRSTPPSSHRAPCRHPAPRRAATRSAHRTSATCSCLWRAAKPAQCLSAVVERNGPVLCSPAGRALISNA